VPGVQSVGVSSGPDGESRFGRPSRRRLSARHRVDLPGFQARCRAQATGS
jgi:hypothetical protein